MNLLQRLPGSRREPPGLEWQILRRLPTTLLIGTALPLGWYLFAAVFPSPAGTDSVEKYLSNVAIAVIATVLTLWTAVLTVAIGCAVVWIMKGPAYVADRYPLSDADAPRDQKITADDPSDPPP